MARVVKSHNAKILGKDDASPGNNNQCNCRKKDLSPLDGACLVNNIVFKATVTTVSDTRGWRGEGGGATRYIFGWRKLAGNLKKYQVLNLGFTQNDSNICVNDVVIETKDNIILLGVVLDSKLNFSEHINSICKKASQRIGVLMRLRNLIPMKSKLILFKSAILPFLTYCHLVWHFCKASDTRKLERLQQRGLGAVFKDNNSTYEQLLEKADLPTLLNSRLQDLCILMYKVKHKLCPTYVSNIFKEPNSNYNLRQADFSIPRYETVTYGKHSIRYLGPKLWTKLPKNIRDVTTLTSFKSKIRQLNISELLDDGCAGCSLCSS